MLNDSSTFVYGASKRWSRMDPGIRAESNESEYVSHQSFDGYHFRDYIKTQSTYPLDAASQRKLHPVERIVLHWSSISELPIPCGGACGATPVSPTERHLAVAGRREYQHRPSTASTVSVSEMMLFGLGNLFYGILISPIAALCQ